MKTADAVEVAQHCGGGGMSHKDAKLMHDLLEAIGRDKGHLATKDLYAEVVARSRPRSSPTHHMFEWDATKGHALYLLERARQLVMRVQVVFVDAPTERVRARPIVVVEGKRGPVAMERVLSNRDMVAQVLGQAKSALDSWRYRYKQLRHLSELSGVFDAIDVALSPAAVANESNRRRRTRKAAA